MAPRDRGLALGLLLAAGLAWLALVAEMSTTYPDTQEIRIGVGAWMGAATALTAAPLAWLASFGRRGGLTGAGDWIRAVRRGVLLGGLVAFLAVLQLTGTMSLAIAAFAVVLVVFVELTLSYRR